MDLLEKVVQSNTQFWKKENVPESDRGYLLYENFYNTPQLCYGISKVALSIAHALKLKPAVIMPIKETAISKSMCETRFQMRDKIVGILFRHFAFICKAFHINRRSLLVLVEDNAQIGACIYDSILIKYKEKTVVSFSLKQRLFIALQLCYYFYFKEILARYPVKAVVLGDCVYRYGLLFELCRLHDITCYTPVNLNSLFICRYARKEDYKKSYLNAELVAKLCKNTNYNAIIEDYYAKRYQGKIEQHDVLTAYGNKKVSDREEFFRKYHLDVAKKTAVIMCHVFADAPHVYLDTLYDDYWDWFVGSLQNLLKNSEINVLVKEHPSAHLYNQKGIVKDYLQLRGLDNILVDENESTESILNNADYVVTCGGTIGLEFSYRGKNVILASYPPFGHMGFTREFSSREDYELFLRNEIQNVPALTSEQLEIAKMVSYVMFYLQDNSPKYLELGGDAILMGKTYDDSVLYNHVLEYNQVPLQEQKIYQLLSEFVLTNQVALFKAS